MQFVTVKDISIFLKEYGTSFFLHGNTTWDLYKMRIWFPLYYNDDKCFNFDNYFITKYGNTSFIGCFEDFSDILDRTKWSNELYNKVTSFLASKINSCALTNEFELQKLLDTTQLIYNPIENYSMTENGTDTEKASTKGTNGTVKNDTVTDTLEKGKVTQTNNSTETPGTMTSEKTRQVAPNDNDNFFNESKEVISENKTPNTTQGTITTDAVTDKNTNTINGKTDVSYDDTKDTTTTHSFTRSGNIGTLTTQEMILSERQVAQFSLFEHFCKLFYEDNLIFYDDKADWNDCIFGW